MPGSIVPPRMDRRRFLELAAGTGCLAAAHRLPGTRPGSARPWVDHPFTLGVASGDPTADGVVLWTRLAPEPLAPDGGMPPGPVPLQWQLAADAGMRTVLRSGRVWVTARFGHAAHVVVDGLAPGREYWYRFRAGGHLSPVGRTVTLPAPGSSPHSLVLAAVSCQDYETGYYTAYRHLAAEGADLVLHLGDYIYEGAPAPGRLRRHAHPEPVDLAGYRMRYGQYKSDQDLAAAHASAPFAVTWDDHEVGNDYAGELARDGLDPAAFRRRRAAAYQAFYEHMPLRRRAGPGGWADYRVYRRLRFGDLAEVSLLDTRQYRDDQPCPVPGQGGSRLVDETCTERRAPGRTMLGARQRDWLLGGLAHSDARWKVIAQQYLMTDLDRRPGPGMLWQTDAWDGYAAERAGLLRFLARRRVRDVVTLGGDIHTYWVTDLRPDPRDPAGPVVGTEFVTTSISSGGWDTSVLLPDNPHVRYAGNERGYLRCTVTRDAWHTDLRGVGVVALPGAPVRTVASFAVQRGRPGVQPA